MLDFAPCSTPRAGFARVLFAFHRRMPLAPAISVLTGADEADRISANAAHNTKNQRVTGSGGGRNGRDGSSTRDR